MSSYRGRFWRTVSAGSLLFLAACAGSEGSEVSIEAAGSTECSAGGVVIVVDGDREVICNGEDGTSSTVEVEELNVGDADCPDGGYQLTVGEDSYKVCNGEDGLQGPAGPAGPEGPEGPATPISVEASTECAAGGWVITIGEGDDAESFEVCNGEDGDGEGGTTPTSSVAVERIEEGDDRCPEGGSLLIVTTFDGSGNEVIDEIPVCHDIDDEAVTDEELVLFWDFGTQGDETWLPTGGLWESENYEFSLVGAEFTGWVGGNNGSAPNSNGWDNGVGSKYWEVAFPTVGLENLRLTSLQRGSNTGPKDFSVQWSADGTSFEEVATVEVGGDWTTGVLNVNLPAAAEEQTMIYVRWVVNSDVAVNGGTVADTGTNRIDEVSVFAELAE